MASDRWDDLPANRFEDEPWWLEYVPDPSPERITAHAELSARAGYDVHPHSFVALDANVNASTFALGARSTIASGCKIRGDVVIGELTGLNPGVVTIGRVSIGNRVRIAAYVVLVGENHVFADPDVPIMDQGLTSEGVVIEDDVWLGAHVVVVDGVTIGAHSVIAAGAVVTHDVEPYSVMAGVPARKLRDRRDRRAPKPSRAPRSPLARFDATVADQWEAVLDRCRIGGADPIAFVEFPGADPRDPRPLNDAIEIAGMFGGLPPGADRTELVARIRAGQDPVTGLFRDPRLPADRALSLRPTHEEWDMYGLLSCGYALEVLGAGPTHPVHAIEQCGAEELEGLLDGLDLGYLAWPSGSWIDGFATGLMLNRVHHGSDNVAPTLWGWLLTHQFRSGMWGTFLEPAGNYDFGWLMAVNGFYRLTRGTYAQFGIDVPRPEAGIDTVLAHARANDWFTTDERNACNLLDIVHPLWLLGRQTDYRRAEIRDAVAALLPGLGADWIDGEGFPWQVGRDPAGLRGTEMFTSVIHLAADLLDEADGLSFTPRGVHRLAPATTLG